LVQGTGNIHDLGNSYVRYSSCRRFGSNTTKRRRSATLHDHPIGSRRVHCPQDRPEVVRVFDSVEYDDEWRPLRAANELFDINSGHVINHRDDTLMYTAA
jgi:hypothetical protein